MAVLGGERWFALFSSEFSSGSIDITPKRINHTVTTKGFGTVWSAGAWNPGSTGGGSVGIVSPIAFFVEIGNVISAARPKTVESTGASSDSLSGIVVVDGDVDFANASNTVVALLSWLEASISALRLAGTSAARTFPPDTLVTFLSGIDDSVTAVWEFAVGSAGLTSSNVDSSSITLLAVFVVNNTITAFRELAGGSAAVRNIGIISSLIALFSSVGVVDLSSSVTTLASVSGRESRNDLSKKTVIASTSAVEEEGNSSLFSSSSVVKIQLHFKVSVFSLDGVLTG